MEHDPRLPSPQVRAPIPPGPGGWVAHPDRLELTPEAWVGTTLLVSTLVLAGLMLYGVLLQIFAD